MLMEEVIQLPNGNHPINVSQIQEHGSALLHRRLHRAEGREEDPEPERVGRQEADGAADRLRPSHQLRQGRQETAGEEGCGSFW